MAFVIGRSMALAAALAALSTSIGAPPDRISPTAVLPSLPQVTKRTSRSKKRKLVPKLTPHRWRGSGMAKSYESRRSLPAGRTSTLKKTARRLRLQAGGR